MAHETYFMLRVAQRHICFLFVRESWLVSLLNFKVFIIIPNYAIYLMT